MTWDQTYRSRRRDRQKLFVVNYADGSRASLRVPHENRGLWYLAACDEAYPRGAGPGRDTGGRYPAHNPETLNFTPLLTPSMSLGVSSPIPKVVEGWREIHKVR